MPKRGFNWKSREGGKNKVKIDKSEEKRIKLDLPDEKSDDFDDCNALALPSTKRKTKVVRTNEPKEKLLTKKQKKVLEKVVERKGKKAKRTELLEKLKAVQVGNDQLFQMVSTSAMQTGKTTVSVNDQGKFVDEDPTIKVSKLSGRLWQGQSHKEKWKKKTEETEMKEESEIDTSDMSTDEEDENVAVAKHQTAPETEMMVDPEEPSTLKEANKQNEDKNKVAPALTGETAKPVRKTLHIPVNREPLVEIQRQKLPVCMEEQSIVEKINDNEVVILSGDTGTGKTTQVPQFLYEAGYAENGQIIGITEPRRMAAVAMSRRIGYEMNLSEKEVSYQIRYEGNTTPETKIKFMTDGVLLKELQTDIELSRYSVIILDEAHERSVYTDILIGLLSRIVKLRNKDNKPMKLIIMSATLRVSDFTGNRKLFPDPPPVIEISSRQFPVTIHFNKVTPKQDYIAEAYKKICKIHKKLPAGGILVFVTSQQEVHLLCSKLKNTFLKTAKVDNIEEKTKKNDDGDDDNDHHRKTANEKIDKLPELSLENYPTVSTEDDRQNYEEGLCENDDNKLDDDDDGDGDDHIPVGDSDDDDGDDYDVMGKDAMKDESPLFVLPLYSLLATDKQALVFEAPPPGSRMCIVATNVAETSLTIPDIKYVVDTGKVKTKFYDAVTGVSTFRVTFISKASANQRSGRAGRTGPGHCYRLYSSAVFNDFELFSEPEITRRPVDDVVLQLKNLGVDVVHNFPFPTPPPDDAIEAAQRTLYHLGALDSTTKFLKGRKSVKLYNITKLGKTLARIPIAPRYAKMLSLGHQYDLMPYVVAMVAGLSVQEVFVGQNHHGELESEKGKDELHSIQELHRKWVGKGEFSWLGDIMLLLKAICLFDKQDNQEMFCIQHGIRIKAMSEIRKLRKQLTDSLTALAPNYKVTLDPDLSPPSQKQANLLRQIVLSGLVDHIARRCPDPVGLSLEEAKKRKNAYEDLRLQELVFIHPNSVLFRSKPEYVVYQQIDETSKMYMKGVTAVEVDWLPTFGPRHTHFDTPNFDQNVPTYDADEGHVMSCMTGKFGPKFWELPKMEGKLEKSIDCTRWFAKFFLDGSVCPKLKPFVPFYLTPPDIMIKAWAHLNSLTTTLLQTLVDKSVWNKETLYSEWKKNPQFLLKEYRKWLPDEQHATISVIWPPL